MNVCKYGFILWARHGLRLKCGWKFLQPYTSHLPKFLESWKNTNFKTSYLKNEIRDWTQISRRGSIQCWKYQCQIKALSAHLMWSFYFPETARNFWMGDYYFLWFKITKGENATCDLNFSRNLTVSLSGACQRVTICVLTCDTFFSHVNDRILI